MSERAAERSVLLLFGASFLSGIGLLIVYILGGQTQIEGILLMVCLGGIGAGIVVWAHWLMPTRVHVEPRGSVATTPEDLERFRDALTEEAGFSRRKLLIGALLGAFGGLGAALAIPVFSLGPAPGKSLFETSWREGSELAPPDGTAAQVADLPIGGVFTEIGRAHV